ncbi:hypothetical protein HAX54_052288 [Datura stramonium]|uniref:Uncharacterized protein n=1 Tax=Datura stramonium TaxID=4076 RepID=A0ABS8T102_DATST|nr:hypothetical protein [Datura stramonium]
MTLERALTDETGQYSVEVMMRCNKAACTTIFRKNIQDMRLNLPWGLSSAKAEGLMTQVTGPCKLSQGHAHVRVCSTFEKSQGRSPLYFCFCRFAASGIFNGVKSTPVFGTSVTTIVSSSTGPISPTNSDYSLAGRT